MSGTTEWLLAAAARLDAEGQHELAREARTEAALPARVPPAPTAVRCDHCQTVIRSERRLDHYDRLGVDWALCARCEL